MPRKALQTVVASGRYWPPAAFSILIILPESGPLKKAPSLQPGPEDQLAPGSDVCTLSRSYRKDGVFLGGANGESSKEPGKIAQRQGRT